MSAGYGDEVDLASSGVAELIHVGQAVIGVDGGTGNFLRTAFT